MTHADTTLPPLMRQAAGQFIALLQACPGSETLPAPAQPPHEPGLVWHNTLFTAPGFRRAHVELLEIPDHFAVVHVCIFPHLTDTAPIFGFDMIAGRTQATGIFMDFSPVTQAPPIPRLADIVTPQTRAAFGVHRASPAWGTIFSPDLFAIRPGNATEIHAALALAQDAGDFYLRQLYGKGRRCSDDETTITAGHARYAKAQRLNPHTYRMLSRYVGAVRARVFIDDVLFPLPMA